MALQNNKFVRRLASAARSAIKPAWRTALWLIKLTIPISLGVTALDYLGVVGWISVRMEPLFGTMGLTGEASLVYISAALANLYTGMAVMFAVGVDYRSATILAVMMLICHNLILETAIQRRSGASPIWMPVLRIGVSLFCGVILNLVMPQIMDGRLITGGAVASHADSWSELLVNWGTTLAPLILKMVVIVTLLNILQSILREFRVLDLIAWTLRPLMRVFGLPLSTSFLWIICNVIGLTYGGAALIDELERGDALPEDARLLNTHVAISHSLLEDTSIFMAIGIMPFWLVVPRLLFAICAVWLQRLMRITLAWKVQNSGAQ